MRYYNSDRTKSAPAWFMRAALISAFPFFVCWSVIDGIAGGFREAWREVKYEAKEFVHLWNQVE